MRRNLAALAWTGLALGNGVACAEAREGDAASPPWWNLHGQFTDATQYHPAFRSPYQGPESMDGVATAKATNDLTLYGGLRLWNGAAIYADPEIDQGFGLSGTLGAASFPSGEAYKVGARAAYFRLPRAFLRQVLDLHGDGEATALEDGANQLAGMLPAENLTITLGKFSAVDLFDANAYAHDPRSDFMNWAVVESGAYDYAADAWGYTWGGAVEWTRAWWTLRGGIFALSKVPNTKDIDGTFSQYELVGEFEGRGNLLGRPGRLRALAYVNNGRMARYADAVALARAQDSLPDASLVRRRASRPGVVLGLEQELAENLGSFLRLSANDGAYEAFDFTEINRSAACGLSLRGAGWQRPDDTVGLALALSGLSAPARAYFAAGGGGLLIGDGRLPSYGLEKVLESYYAAQVVEHLTLSADLQLLANPAYNRDRGPVTVMGVRVHAEF